MEGQTCHIALRNVVHILLVLFGEDNIGNSGSLSCQNFLLDAPDGKHLATQRNLTCHGYVRPHLALGEQRSNGGGQRDTGRRAVLGSSSLRHVNVQVPVVENTILELQQIGVAFHKLQSQHRTLFHHVTQVTRNGESRSLRAAHTTFDEQNFSAHSRPS